MTDPIAQLRQAAALHQTGRLAEAEPLYAAVLTALPGHPDALHLYGVLCAQTGRHARAVELIGAAIARKSHSGAYHANLARALRAEGRLAEAAGSLRRAIALQPSADAFFSLGNILKQSGHMQEALARFRCALILHPEAPETRMNAASVLETLGRRDEALRQLRAGLACDPANPALLFNLARTEQAAGNADHAACGYRRALRTTAEGEDSAVNLGTALLEAGRPAEAVDALRRCAALAPDRAERLLALATALRQAGAVDGCLTVFQRLKALTPTDPTPWQRSAEVQEAAGRLDACVATLLEVARLSREGRFHWKTAYYHLVRIGNLLIGEGRLDRVAALLPPAVAAFRGVDAELHAWALFLQGSLATRLGEAAAAQEAFRRAEPHLPFLAHIPTGDGFARRIEALSPAADMESEAAFVLETLAPSGNGPVVVASCDSGYLERFGPLFLASLDRFSTPGQAAHLHILDPRPDTAARVRALEGRLRHVRLGWSHETSPAGLTAQARTTFYTFARFLRVPRLSRLYQAPLMVADIDACLLSDPVGFLAPLSAATPLALQHFPDNLARLYDGVGGGLVVMRPDPAVIALFDRIRRFLVSWIAERRLHYFLDQIALTAGTDDAVRRGDGPSILPIPVKGRLFLCGDGLFVQILTEKDQPGFAASVAALLDRLERTPPAPDPQLDRSMILKAIGVMV
ncbi:tetratricopeptide repeat protein [Azospirillum brasilense]|uniref:tetratricopeptide repeat protein n=1 Tax=Azospirillum brasilense TaxID=192 RepID=UPI000E6A1FD4|nr:tetratricopeptide repeat protein [Azospirillum brasilense]NUB27047.1 tetratricopeptide repeat protein [Azospirillum brasilense]NUB34822.1 tetratricopeptide repeat protein [Azospirillum brasilense]RIV99511.1 tetratricopeptide repeat protein [Azospirillum brasilense]